METDDLRNTLMTHLNTLSRNLAVVSREELKTRYHKPYYALVRDISTSASAYVRQIALAGLRIRQEYLPEAVPVINNTIQSSGIQHFPPFNCRHEISGKSVLKNVLFAFSIVSFPHSFSPLIESVYGIRIIQRRSSAERF